MLKMFRLVSILFLSFALSFVGCVSRTPDLSRTPSVPNEEVARDILFRYFSLLHSGSYREASELYGGSYETMIDHNPLLDPSDHASLFRNACEINGAQCLEVAGTPILESASGGEYYFRVQFAADDGSVFERGPCCGGTGSTEASFLVMVKEVAPGELVVMDAPVYVP